MTDTRVWIRDLHTAYRTLAAGAAMRRADGCTWADIAAEAGVSRRTLRRYLRRAERIRRRGSI